MATSTPPLLAWERRALARALAPAGDRSLGHARRALDAATALMEAGEELTTTSIAARAGMSLKTLYKHFTSKDELLLALYEHSTADTAALLRERLTGAGVDPVDALGACVRELFRLSWANPSIARTLIAGHWRLSREHPVELEESRRPFVDLFADLVADGVAQGQLRADAGRGDAELVLSLVLTRLHAAAPRFDEPFDDAGAERVVAFCLHALGAAPRPPQRRQGVGRAARTRAASA